MGLSLLGRMTQQVLQLALSQQEVDSRGLQLTRPPLGRVGKGAGPADKNVTAERACSPQRAT